MASEAVFHHERSSSAPGSAWRSGPFGDALMACVTGPSYMPSNNNNPSESANVIRLEPSPPLGKPLSPILSPSIKPSLKVDTSSAPEAAEKRPEVPPKSPSHERRGSPAPLVLHSKSSRTQLMTPASLTSGGNTPSSAIDSRRSPLVNGALPTPLSAMSNPFSAGSPSSAFDRRASPRVEKRDPFASHSRGLSDTSVMDRGRPVQRSSKRQRSRTSSEANNPETPAQDTWKMPRGMRVHDASMHMNQSDQDLLHKQAYDQAEKFEVLNKRDVASMSRVSIPEPLPLVLLTLTIR